MTNKYYVKIEGKDSNYFLRKIISQKINYKLINIAPHEINIVVYQTDYYKIKKIKTSYKVKLIKVVGPKGFVNLLKTKSYLFVGIIVFINIVYLLSNICFSVEISTSNNKIKEILLNDLDNYGIRRLSFMKDFKNKEIIEKKILESHKDLIEWLEITRIGTKYLVKIEERKINDSVKDETIRHLVAKKDGIILNINAARGEVVKKQNDYVKKGDIIISGAITKKDEIKSFRSALGVVYAEVWYKVNVTVPYHYYEEKITGKSKYNLIMNYISDFIRFSFNNYKDNDTKYIFNIKNNLLPISFGFAKDNELLITDKTYTYDEAMQLAFELSKEKLKTISPNAVIISQKDLKIEEDKSKIKVDIFMRVKEDITDYLEFDPNSINVEERNG